MLIFVIKVLTVCIVSFTSFFIDVRIKWKTMFRISVSSPFRFIACSKVCFISSLQTSGEHASFCSHKSRKKIEVSVFRKIWKARRRHMTDSRSTYLNRLEKIAVDFHLLDVLRKLERRVVDGSLAKLLHRTKIWNFSRTFKRIKKLHNFFARAISILCHLEWNFFESFEMSRKPTRCRDKLKINSLSRTLNCKIKNGFFPILRNVKNKQTLQIINIFPIKEINKR